MVREQETCGCKKSPESVSGALASAHCLLEKPPPGSPSSSLTRISPTTAPLLKPALLQWFFKSKGRDSRAHLVLSCCSARETEAQREVGEAWPRTQGRAGPPADPGLWALGSEGLLPRPHTESSRLPSANILPHLGPELTLQGTFILHAADHSGSRR